MSGVAVLAHSGGPTPVINASLLGVVQASRRLGRPEKLWAARFGIEGILREEFVDLLGQPQETLDRVAHSPSSAIGSSRREVQDADLGQVLSVFRKHDVRYFYYTGGNGSMGTANQIDGAARASGYELHVVGIPKTIDNDIVQTHHTPGYGSAARFFAEAARDIGADNEALPGQVEFLEVLGRNAGWLVAATSLARRDPDDPPHLIYFPEVPLPFEKLVGDIDRVYTRLGRCMVAVCEGQLDEAGNPFGADVRQGSRGALAMNLGHRLAMMVSAKLRLKTRAEKPGLLGRSSAAFISDTDWEESRMCGEAAVEAADRVESGKMVALCRRPSPKYEIDTQLVPLSSVALTERLFPAEWRNGDAGMPEYRAYAEPLTGPIPGVARLQRKEKT
jgi:ATP-dependent phosphofructokinase / diphosphate-dependent phosphofructokinase